MTGFRMRQIPSYEDGRTIEASYYAMLCSDYVTAHRLFISSFYPHEVSQIFSQEALDEFTTTRLLRAMSNSAVRLGREYASREQSLLLKLGNDFKHSLESLKGYGGSAFERADFEDYVKEMASTIRRESRDASRVSGLVQRHFWLFAVEPARVGKSQGAIFYSLAKTMDKTFREPLAGNIAHYLREVEQLKLLPRYHSMVEQCSGSGKYSTDALQLLEEQLRLEEFFGSTGAVL